MPPARIDLQGSPRASNGTIGERVRRARRETFDVPENDRLVVGSEHDADNSVHAGSINLAAVKKQDRSFGNGVAQHV